MKKWLLLIGLISLGTTAFADKLNESNKNKDYVANAVIEMQKALYEGHDLSLMYMQNKVTNKVFNAHTDKIKNIASRLDSINTGEKFSSCKRLLDIQKNIWLEQAIYSREMLKEDYQAAFNTNNSILRSRSIADQNMEYCLTSLFNSTEKNNSTET